VQVHVSPLSWSVRFLWLVLPLTLGDLIGDAVDGRSAPVLWTVAIGSWAVWLAGLVASLVPLPPLLVVLRVLAPVPLAAGLTSALVETPGVTGWIGLVMAAVLTVAANSAEVGMDHLNGTSYGDERRLPLRPPGILLLGPIPLLWAAMTLLPATGVLLLAARQWVLGGLAVAAGAGAVWFGTLALLRLTRRWLVLVPAGATLVDAFALTEPVLMRRNDIVRLGPAPVGSAATDLSVGATGLIVEVALREPQSFLPAVRGGETVSPLRSAAVLIAPSRPGLLMRLAADRKIAVGVD
jgi:hypothetical protein